MYTFNIVLSKPWCLVNWFMENAHLLASPHYETIWIQSSGMINIHFFVWFGLVSFGFWDRVSLCRSGWPQACGSPPAWTFQVLGSQGSTTTVSSGRWLGKEVLRLPFLSQERSLLFHFTLLFFLETEPRASRKIKYILSLTYTSWPSREFILN